MESVEIRGVQAVSDDAVLGVLASAVPLRPVRAGTGKGIGQRNRVGSLATSEAFEEVCEETVDGIAAAIARESEICLANRGRLKVIVDGLEGLSASMRGWRVVELGRVLEEKFAHCPPAGVPIVAEIREALARFAGGQQPDLAADSWRSWFGLCAGLSVI